MIETCWISDWSEQECISKMTPVCRKTPIESNDPGWVAYDLRLKRFSLRTSVDDV